MSNPAPSEASAHLIGLATRNARIYTTLPELRALILTGSAVEGTSDYYSDIDMIAYYETLPSEETLADAARQNGGTDRKPLGPRMENQAAESYQVRGVECQVAHTTITAWEEEMATVLDKLEVATPLQKALSGLLECIPLYGEPLIRGWQTRLKAYPDALAKAMVEQYLTFFPLWGLQDRLESRDATVWINEVLVQTSQNLLGVMAGLNHVYYSPFQFKRMHRFVEKLVIKPDDLAERIEALFHTEAPRAAVLSESLVKETVILVERHMPQVDTTRARSRIGWRQQAWKPPLGE